jgi:alpha-galactosidase
MIFGYKRPIVGALAVGTFLLCISIRPSSTRSASAATPILNQDSPAAVSAKLGSCSGKKFGVTLRDGILAIAGPNLTLEFNRNLHSRIIAHFEGSDTERVIAGPFSASEFLLGDRKSWKDFAFVSHQCGDITDSFGNGKQVELTGKSGTLTKVVKVTLYRDFPSAAVVQAQYINDGSSPLKLTGWVNNAYTLTAHTAQLPKFWSYQSGSYEQRPDWLVPLKVGFHQQNYLGMNASDYGGGTPIVDLWSRSIGVAVGDLRTVPNLVSLPVAMPDEQHSSLQVLWKQDHTLMSGQTLQTFRTFVIVHKGDYYSALVEYRKFMQKQGSGALDSPKDAFQPIWCAWGYGRTFSPKQIDETLPTVKKLGFSWVGVDDGWQSKIGDWTLDATKFPHGDADMRALVDRIHKAGFKAQLWWSPLSAVPDSDLLKQHPDMELIDVDGTPRKISWWDSDYLCPAYSPVIENQEAIVKKIIGDWGFDGLKLDGQHMNGVPRCYNRLHHHKSPEDSVESLPHVFQKIFDTARSIKPDALVEFCPCGTSYSFFTMPFYNMSVASDPKNSWQVRLKGKTLKALMGDETAYFGDHVELSDGADDFASTIGIGGVVGSEFVLSALAEKKSKSELTPGREKQFAKWLRIYNDNMPSTGKYLGTLYDIGFDKPEAHAIRKDNIIYYAFYAKIWNGDVQLRGLADREYSVVNYETGKTLGKVHGPSATVAAPFRQHLLLRAIPDW